LRVMGIDPGLTRLGFGVVEGRGSKLSAVASGTIVTPAGGGTAERLVSLFEQLGEAIREHRPEAAAVERIFFNLNARTAVPAIQSSGVALVAAASEGVAVTEYTPLEVKTAVTGTGTASKDQVGYMVQKLLRLKAQEGADASDALALAICHLHSSKLRSMVESAK